MNNEINYISAIEHIVTYCGNLQRYEKVVILYDSLTKSIAKLFAVNVLKITAHPLDMIEIETAQIHGVEPPQNAREKMLSADLIICLTFYSLAHTKARLEATQAGARFLSLPQYTDDLLRNKAILFKYKDCINELEKVTELLNKGKKIKITTIKGTQVSLVIEGRTGNCCPGIVNEKYNLGSPPDSEVNIAPEEDKSKGVIVVDGSITCAELGLLNESVELKIANGCIADIKSDSKYYKETLEKIFSDVKSKKAYCLAECGIGFNKDAILCGNMLIDEGAFGYVHFGFGSNCTISGKNDVNFHLDFVICEPTLTIDDFCVLKDGRLLV